MRESGCDIPYYMLAMKKHSKKEKRKLERAAPAREKISTIPKFKRVYNKENKRYSIFKFAFSLIAFYEIFLKLLFLVYAENLLQTLPISNKRL